MNGKLASEISSLARAWELTAVGTVFPKESRGDGEWREVTSLASQRMEMSHETIAPRALSRSAEAYPARLQVAKDASGEIGRWGKSRIRRRRLWLRQVPWIHPARGS